MDKDILSDDKLYEMAMNAKFHAEERRDDINKFYISLFSALISVSPFISNIIDRAHISYNYTICFFLIALSLIGLSLSISWILMLKRTNYYLKGIDYAMMDIEEKNNKKLVLGVSEYLEEKKAPERVTKQQIIIPYVFTLIFVMMLGSIVVYNIMKAG